MRTDAGYVIPVVQQLEKAFKTMPGRRSFSYELMSDKVDKQYTLLDGILKVTNYIALLTILIASMGMFGLIALVCKATHKRNRHSQSAWCKCGGYHQIIVKRFFNTCSPGNCDRIACCMVYNE